jgi:VWFA-related protein
MRPLSRLLFVLFLLPGTAFAQFEEKVTVSYVEVPVSVVGRDGKAVRGLTQANFEVYDDNVKRPIDSFEAIDFGAAATAKSISPLNPASRRNFLLLFDLSYSSPISLGRAQDAARNFVARNLGRRDLVAIGTVDADTGFKFLTAFTSDRNLLAAAIGDPRNFRSFDPLQIGSSNLFIVNNGPESAGGEVSAGKAAGDETAMDFVRANAKMDDSHRRMRVRNQFKILGQVASALQRLRGRKHLVLLSEGFDARLVQGRDVASTKEQNDENAAIVDGESWKADSDMRFGNAGMQTVLGEMAEEFRKADVVLHAVDIQGVRVQNDVREGARVNSNDSLFLMANSTGGTVFRNSNDLTNDFQRLSDQQQVVYVLGINAAAGRSGEFHQIKVKVNGVPGARVQHRGGYYDTGNEGTIARALSNAEVVLNDIAQDDIDVAALVSAFPATGGKGDVPVILEISGADLAEHAGNAAAHVDIFVYAFDDEGIARDAISQRVTLDMTKAGEKLRAGGIKFYGTLGLPPGKYAIKSLVRIAETDTKGYRRVDVTVPDEYDVAVLQPMFFEQPGDWIMAKNERAGNKAPYPFILDGESFIPAAKAKLRQGEPRLFTVFVYNAAPEELTWTSTPAATLVSQKRGQSVVKYVFALDKVTPGTTAVDVTFRKPGSSEARTVSVPVVVQ